MHLEVVVIISIIIRATATAWSILILYRMRDWRVGFLTLMLALMTLRQLLTLVTHEEPLSDPAAELPGLMVSAMAFLAVFFVERMLTSYNAALTGLQVSEERYRSLVEDQVDLVCQFKPNGELTFVNRAYADYFGKTSDDLVGYNFLDLIPGTDRDKMVAHLASFGPSRKVAQIVHEVSTPGVERRWQEWTDHAFLDKSGQVIGFQSIGRDITERHLAERALRSSEELNRRIIEALPGGLVHVALDGQVLRANAEAHRILGIPSEKMTVVNINDLEPWTVYEDGVTCPAEEYPATKCLATGKPQPATVLGTFRPNGEIVWAVYTAVPVHEPETGELEGAVLTCFDITERRSAEEALRDSEANNRALVQAVPDALFRISKDLVYLDYVPAEGFDTYLAPTDFLGRSLAEVMPASVSKKAEKSVRNALRSNEMQVFEYDLEMNGSTRYYEARVVPDRTESVLAVIRDITDRRLAEREREQLLLELEAKNRELERFARTVSHDLKSPLITIRGFMEVLEDDRASVSERARQAIDRINSAARTMLSLLDELLELARVGQVVNPPEQLPFGELVRSAVDHVAGRIVNRGVHVEIEPDLPFVYGDRMRLLQVLRNVIDNAVKFMGDQRRPRIEIGARDRHSEVLCYVKDNGAGIDPRYRDRVFAVFDRLHRDVEGTGIGLALAKRIIEVHGGRIWVESEGVGKGSTFFFSLPKPSKASGMTTTSSAA